MARLTQLVGLLAFSSSLLSPLVAAQVDGSHVIDTSVNSRQVDGSRIVDTSVNSRQVDGSRVYDDTIDTRQVDGSRLAESDGVDARQVDGPRLGKTEINARQVDGSRIAEGDSISSRQVDGSRFISETDFNARQVDGSRITGESAVDVDKLTDHVLQRVTDSMLEQVDGSRVIDSEGVNSRQVDGSQVINDVDIHARQVDGSRLADGDSVSARQVDGSKQVDSETIGTRQVGGSRIIGDASINARQVDGSRVVEGESINARDSQVVVAANDFQLRIMPLGASMTLGLQSEDNNGYRKTVYERLVSDGWTVNMVGSRENGTMAENSHEGWPAYTVDGVHGKFTQSKGLKPNVVLLNAGTNDCFFNVDPAGAGKRLTSLIDDIFVSIPGVTVVMSTLLPSRVDGPCVTNVSEQYRAVFASYEKQKRRVALADIQKELDLELLSLDGIHPGDEGYVAIGGLFHDAVTKVQGQIQKPL
ncbi:carbohydrate esterase family 3 protein [Apiospora phragmitis]|uniref:Carbohydrate esterase family 3 protein n=1 Tax=Apiospora phragmitis TaxID=2905665 RepID=A0ABR1SUI2_9PEZI